MKHKQIDEFFYFKSINAIEELYEGHLDIKVDDTIRKLLWTVDLGLSQNITDKISDET